MKKILILLGLFITIIAQSQTVTYPGTRIFTGTLQIAVGAQFNFKGNYITNIQTGDTIATLEGIRLLLGSYLTESDTAELIATQFGLSLKLNRTDTVDLVATKFDLTQKLGINATAVNSELLAGKDTTYIKENWGKCKLSVNASMSNIISNYYTNAILYAYCNTDDVAYEWSGPGAFSSNDKTTITAVSGLYRVITIKSGCDADTAEIYVPGIFANNGNYWDGDTLKNNTSAQIHDTINNLAVITFDTLKTQLTQKAGQISWNQEDGTLDVRLYDNCTMQVGQEVPIRVQNNTGVDIDNHKLVYIIAAGGEIPRIMLADNRYSNAAYSIIGETTTPVPHGGTGYVTRLGKIHDASNAGYEGQPYYLGTNGDKTFVKPTNAHVIKAGSVIYAHASEGIDYVDIKPESATNFGVFNNDVSVRVDIDTINGVVYTGIDTTSKPDGWLPPKEWVMDYVDVHTLAPDTVTEIETRYHAGNTYHPLLGLTTLNMSMDTAKLRGTVKINDSTVIYMPQPQTSAGFQNSIFFGTGGRYISHTSSTQGQNNISVGFGALQSITIGQGNSSIGFKSLFALTSGGNNVCFGSNSGSGLTTASNVVSLGRATLTQNSTGGNNVVIGSLAGQYGIISNSVIIGTQAGQGLINKGLTQTGQIKIGFDTGSDDSTSNTLYIDNSNTQTPLLGGRFDLNRVSINKLMPACGDSTLDIGGGLSVDRGLYAGLNISAQKFFMRSISDTSSSTDLQIMPKLWILDRISGGSTTQDSFYNELTVRDTLRFPSADVYGNRHTINSYDETYIEFKGKYRFKNVLVLDSFDSPGYPSLYAYGGIYASATSRNGIDAFSKYKNGITAWSQSGYNIAKFYNDANDSLTVRLDATIHQFTDGSEVFKTTTTGNIDITGDYLKNGVPIGSGGIVLPDSFSISRRGVDFDSIVGLKLDRSESWYYNDTIRDTLRIHVDTSQIGGSASITFVVDSTYIPTIDVQSRDAIPIPIEQDPGSDDYDNTVVGYRTELFIWRNGDRIWYSWRRKDSL